MEGSENRALHFEAAARIQDLLVHSVLALVDWPGSYHPSLPDALHRYAWMKFSDGHPRHVLIEVSRRKSKSGASLGYFLESIEVLKKARRASLATGSAPGNSSVSSSALEAFHRQIRPEHRYVEGGSNGRPRAAPAGSIFASELSRDGRAYLRIIKRHTGIRIPRKQRRLLAKHLRENSHIRLTTEEGNRSRDEFDRVRQKTIAEWERQTEQKWPRYTENALNDAGEVVRYKGFYYDAHHLIENIYNGPHVWWNLVPARSPDVHQNGIHVEPVSKRLQP